jgi:hypothetical protein
MNHDKWRDAFSIGLCKHDWGLILSYQSNTIHSTQVELRWSSNNTDSLKNAKRMGLSIPIGFFSFFEGRVIMIYHTCKKSIVNSFNSINCLELSPLCN